MKNAVFTFVLCAMLASCGAQTRIANCTWENVIDVCLIGSKTLSYRAKIDDEEYVIANDTYSIADAESVEGILQPLDKLYF